MGETLHIKKFPSLYHRQDAKVLRLWQSFAPNPRFPFDLFSSIPKNRPDEIPLPHPAAGWVIISSNFSSGGGFGFTNAAPLNASPQFFRSLLVQ
jgi:hypothetical protein